MPRLMSVALTEAAVLERRKTVTRRIGWNFLKGGERLTLCRKVMGRKPDEPLVRIVDVEVVSTRWEPLSAITDEDVAREGFPNLDRDGFIRFFCQEMACYPETLVNRIEWRYLERCGAREVRVGREWACAGDPDHGGPGHYFQVARKIDEVA